MTNAEFQQWLADYRGKFPSVDAWLGGLRDPVALLSVWEAVLTPVKFRTAIQVTHQMATGQLEPVGSYPSERERTAVYVKRAAEEIEDANRPKDQGAPAPLVPRYKRKQRDAITMRSAIEQVERLIKSGRDRAEAVGQVCPSDEDGPRYKCGVCHDSGLVEVWAPMTVQAFRDSPDNVRQRINRRTCVTPCSCEAGQAKVWNMANGNPPKHWSGWTDQHAIYNSGRHCRVVGSKHSEAAIEALLQWCAEFWERVDEARRVHLELNAKDERLNDEQGQREIPF